MKVEAYRTVSAALADQDGNLLPGKADIGQFPIGKTGQFRFRGTALPPIAELLKKVGVAICLDDGRLACEKHRSHLAQRQLIRNIGSHDKHL